MAAPSTRSAAGDAELPAQPLLIGLEHEFVVHGSDGVADFRSVIHRLSLGQPNLDPTDPLAYRLPSGAAVTCDAAEAEIALPPTFIGPRFASGVAWRANVERTALARRLPRGLGLEGYSTHISVSVSDALTQAVCRMYATTFAPAMMLLLDRRQSAGLLIRPRPGRVELGGDYLVGDQLVVAAAFAVASVLTCADLARRGTSDGLPDELKVRVDPAVARFGWYVDRTAFGGDLYAEGRRAVLTKSDGQSVSAQVHLEQCWRLSRPAIVDVASADELAVVDEAVRGERPVPTDHVTGAHVSRPASARSAATAYGDALAVRARPSFDVAAVMLTWELAVFLILDRRHRRRAFAVVPGTHLGPVLTVLDSGGLDDEINRFLRGWHRARRLRSWAEIVAPALYDEIGPRIRLLRPEFDSDGRPMAERPRSSGRLRGRLQRPVPLGRRSAVATGPRQSALTRLRLGGRAGA